MVSEQQARKIIDHLLTQAGWQIQNVKDVNIHAGLGVEIQSDKYSKGLPDGLPAWTTPLPLCYQSTGEITRFTNNSVCVKFAYTAADGKTYQIKSTAALPKFIPQLTADFEKEELSRYTPCNFKTREEQVQALAVVHTELLLRSNTSVGANVEEGQAGQSEADFLPKYSIACKEARETHYWLRLLSATGIVPEERLKELRTESDELVAILTTIVKKVKKKKREV